MARDFRDLRVWEEAMRLAELVYAVARALPDEERYGLSAQIRRAAVSVPSCIAEGGARASTRDYLRFLSIARGSLAEVQTQLLLAARLELASASLLDVALAQVERTRILLDALRKALTRLTA